MTKISTIEIPSRAKHLYIKLYCEKKGGETNENIHNAAQSWLSLSLTKKQHFYNTISTKSAVKKAQPIIKTVPYLKPKIPANVSKNKRKHAQREEHQGSEESDSELPTTDNLFISDGTNMGSDNSSHAVVEENYNIGSEILPMTIPLEGENHIPEERTPELDELVENEPQMCDGNLKQQKSYTNVIDEDTDSVKEDNINEKNAGRIPLFEPVLPVTKTGKDLFDLLKARNGVNKTYESLTKREKNFYGRAVRAIKRDYVKKYKEFLESLPSRQLFEYYMKLFH